MKINREKMFLTSALSMVDCHVNYQLFEVNINEGMLPPSSPSMWKYRQDGDKHSMSWDDLKIHPINEEILKILWTTVMWVIKYRFVEVLIVFQVLDFLVQSTFVRPHSQSNMKYHFLWELVSLSQWLIVSKIQRYPRLCCSKSKCLSNEYK